MTNAQTGGPAVLSVHLRGSSVILYFLYLLFGSARMSVCPPGTSFFFKALNFYWSLLFFCCRLFILGVNENSNSTSTTDLQWDRVSDTSHWHQEQSSKWENFDQSESGQATNQPIRNHLTRCVASVWVISSISGIKSKNQWRHAPSWHRHLFPNIWYSMIEWDVWALGLVTVAVLCWLLPYHLILNNILLKTICMKRKYQGEFLTNLWAGCLCLRPGLGSF